jgi:hypothetical protein
VPRHQQAGPHLGGKGEYDLARRRNRRQWAKRFTFAPDYVRSA